MICGAAREDLDEIIGSEYIKYPRVTKLALAASEEAVEMAGLKDNLDNDTAVFMATASGTIDESERIIYSMNNGERQRVNMLGMMYYHGLASSISGHFKLNGISRTLTCGCSASLEALQDAILHLKSGLVKTCIVGGSDSSFGDSIVTSMKNIRAISFSGEFDNYGVPFSKKSKGFVISETAAVVVLELESEAIRRGANILGVVEEVRSNNDGKGMFSSEKTGKNLLNLINQTLKEDIPTYINSQGLGLKENDLIEINNYKSIVKNNECPITSIKGITGHPFGASGILQLVSSLISIEFGFIPKIVRLNREDVYDTDVNYVFDTIHKEISNVLITSHGYGGNNSVALISKYK
ncbi:Actinorhodin polyketide putative beta-ketoacyl synthase 1 [compost metagenome]